MPTKTLAELDAGDIIKTNEGRPEWLRIINISALYNKGEIRYALVEQVGGKRVGIRFPMNLHNYANGWTVRA
jgi:hypothetical protein